MVRVITLPAKVPKGGAHFRRLDIPVPNLPTEFEREVERLGLRQEKYTNSPELRAWCQRHRDHFYIPERLLKRWGLTVDTWEDAKSRAA